jgi:hypothetical protein
MRKMHNLRIILIALSMVFVLGIVSDTAMAGVPPIPPTPTPQPSQPSGGYSSPATYSPPVFQPYTEDIKSTNGIVLGQLEGIDFSTVRLTASGNGAIGGDTISLDIRADLNSKPEGVTLDIIMGGEGNLPGGMDNVVKLSTAGITARSKYGWSLKPGTVTFKFTMPTDRLDAAGPDAKYYLVRYDGSGYQINSIDIIKSGSIATVETNVPDVSGTYTVVMTCPPKATAMPSPTPIPSPAPTVTSYPTPTPAPSGIMGYLSSIWGSIIGTFVVGGLIGASAILVLGKIFW